jgi:hypothetical protein
MRPSAAADLPTASVICQVCFWVLVAVQVVFFLLVLAGVHRLGGLSMAQLTSGGGAAYELRAPRIG